MSHSDQGGEFLSDKLKHHQDMRGTKHKLTIHDSPQQNGVSKCGMHTHAEHARVLLIPSGLPQFLWEEAMKHTTWIQDRTPACANAGKSPYEMRHKKKPEYRSSVQQCMSKTSRLESSILAPKLVDSSATIWNRKVTRSTGHKNDLSQLSAM